MEGFFLLKEMLLPGDKMCQIDLKYTYFAISLEIQEVSQISVENPSIQFLLLSLLRAFSSSSGLYKVLKSPYLSLEKTQCKNNNLPWQHGPNGIFIIGLADGKRYADIHTSTLRVSYQYQKVLPRANINFIWFFGLIVNSRKITLRFPKEKLLKVENPCQEILEKEKVTVRELSKLIGRLLSTAIAVLSAPLHYHHLQHQQIQEFIWPNFFENKLIISVVARKELLWWRENLALCNGRSLISPPPQIITSSDDSLQGWWASCQGLRTRGSWSVEKWRFHINVLELKAAKLAIIYSWLWSAKKFGNTFWKERSRLRLNTYQGQ